MELLDATGSYLLKNEPELKKEVYGIMRPLIVLQSERTEYEIQRITEQMQRIESERHKIKTENETAIQKSIEKFRASGQSRQEVKENIQDIFSLSQEEVEEKIEEYWKQKDE